jgi:hypothetical protein
MSSALDVCTVSRRRIAQLLGSGNLAVLDESEPRCGRYFDDVDRHFADNWDEEEAERPLPCREAGVHLLNGGPYCDDSTTQYILVFETLCCEYGQRLASGAFEAPIWWEWIETVDRYLAEIDFPLRVAALAAGGLPFAFPHHDVMPSIGHWSHEPLAQARDQLAGHGLDGVAGNVTKALTSISGWLDAALLGDDNIIVGVYS